MLAALIRGIEQKKAQLDRLRPLSAGALAQLQKYYDVELTYTSNAIEGNTLTRRETADVIEHGITVGGKSLREHLEAVDHYDALQWMRGLAVLMPSICEDTVCELHRRIVARSRPAIAGIYSPHPRRAAGSPVIFPNPLKVPGLMEEFGAGLSQAPSTPKEAFEAHFQLAAIHPFSDGSGRTARLLMNLVLFRDGSPPVAVRPEDRKLYLEALEQGSLSGDLQSLLNFMYERLDATLGEYVSALDGALRQPGQDC